MHRAGAFTVSLKTDGRPVRVLDRHHSLAGAGAVLIRLLREPPVERPEWVAIHKVGAGPVRPQAPAIIVCIFNEALRDVIQGHTEGEGTNAQAGASPTE
jgi:hypothetical protein